MTAASNYLENLVLDWLTGTNAPSAPTTLYMALFATNPTDANTGTEVTTVIRPAGRVAATFGTRVDSGTKRQVSNTGVVDFGNAAGAATVTHWGIFDAASGGNLLMHGALATSRAFSAGDPVQFPIARVNLQVD